MRITNAWETLLDFGMCFRVVEIDMKRQRLRGDITGAKQLQLLQL